MESSRERKRYEAESFHDHILPHHKGLKIFHYILAIYYQFSSIDEMTDNGILGCLGFNFLVLKVCVVNEFHV